MMVVFGTAVILTTEHDRDDHTIHDFGVVDTLMDTVAGTDL